MAAETPVADPQGTVNRQQLRDHLVSAEFREALIVHAQGIGLVTNENLRAIVSELLTHHTAEFSQQGAAIMDTAAKMNTLADKVVQSTQEFDAKNAEAKAELSTLSATQALLVDQLNEQFATLKGQQTEMEEQLRVTRAESTTAYGSFEERLKTYTEGRERLFQVKLEEAERKFRETSQNIVQDIHTSTGGKGSGGGARDRQVFDPREYKMPDLPSDPSLAQLKKWRRDVEIFTDTLGDSWQGVSSLLRHCRLIDHEFDQDAGLDEVISAATRSQGKRPVSSEYLRLVEKQTYCTNSSCPNLMSRYPPS